MQMYTMAFLDIKCCSAMETVTVNLRAAVTNLESCLLHMLCVRCISTPMLGQQSSVLVYRLHVLT